VNFGQLLAIIRTAWVSISMMVAVASLVAFAFSSSLTKEYSAKARVMLNTGNLDPTQYSALKRNTETSYLATQIRLVGDDGVLREVATKLGWPSDPAVIAAWEQATGGKGDVTTWAARRLAGAVAAQQFEDSSIIEIYYTAPSVDIAKTVVALIREAYIGNDLRLRVDAARKASSWNRTIAAQSLVTLQKAEAARAAFMRTNQITIDSSNGSVEMLAFSSLISASVPSKPTTLTPEATPAMLRLKQQIADLDAQILVFGGERGPNDPVIINMTGSRDILRQQLARETAFAQAGSHATDAQTIANRAQRNREYLEARLRVLDRAPVYDRLAALDREIALRTRLYINAEQRVQNFEAIAAAPSGMLILGDVIADDDMVFPNTPVAVALAAGLTLTLGIAITLLGEMMRRMVRGAEDLEFYSGVPVMAVIAEAVPRKSWFGRLGGLARLGRLARVGRLRPAI